MGIAGSSGDEIGNKEYSSRIITMDMLIGMISDADHGSTSLQCYTQLSQANIQSD